MLGVYASAVAILLASLVFGTALLRLLGRSAQTPLSGAVGFAALVIACPLLIRLPGRATTLAILLAIALIATLVYLRWGTSVPGTGRLVGRGRGRRRGGGEGLARDGRRRPTHAHELRTAAIVVVVVVAAASLTFLFNERNGVLGEGVYTNDQAAQLFWTDWLQNGVGPEPKAVQFGYPTGPQSVAAAAAETTNSSLLGRLQRPPARDPGAHRARGPRGARAPPARRGGRSPHPSPACRTWPPPSWPRAPSRRPRWRSWCSRSRSRWASWAGACPRAPTSLTHGGRWSWRWSCSWSRACSSTAFQGSPGSRSAAPIWLALALATGGLRIDLEAVRETARRHRRAIVVVAIVVIAVGAFSAAQLSGFVGKVGQVQASAGQAQLAGVPRRGAGRVAGGRLPRRPGRRRPAPIRRWRSASSRPRSVRSARSGAASGDWWRWGRAP